MMLHVMMLPAGRTPRQWRISRRHSLPKGSGRSGLYMIRLADPQNRDGVLVYSNYIHSIISVGDYLAAGKRTTASRVALEICSSPCLITIDNTLVPESRMACGRNKFLTGASLRTSCLGVAHALDEPCPCRDGLQNDRCLTHRHQL
jgi:hypothetical protein